ncbi:MAG: hypothetical protein ACXWVR_00460 [Rhodoplanes sp.]
MISGRQALATVEQTIAQARREEARLDSALREATGEAVRLRADRTAAFRELAKVKLDTLASAGVVQELDAAERRALAILEQGRRSAADFAKRREQAERSLEQSQAEREARAAELDEALAALSELRAQVEAQTRVSPEWAAERARIDELSRMTEAAEKKTVQAEADREEKRKPYESHPLFMYLWDRRFSTADYAAGPFVRFFDRKVAKLVGYDKARAAYAMLNAIPTRLREHAGRLREELQGGRARLTTIEREALEKSGAKPLEARVRERKAAFDTADRKLANARAELDKIEQAGRTGVASGEASYAQAIELLASADAAQDLRSLYREAAQTPDPTDEAILKRIESTENAIGRAEKETGAIRREMQELARRRKQIESERDEFRRRGYDDPFGSFSNERVLASVLGGILGGMLQGTVLRDVLNEGYRRQPGPWDSDFGGGASFPGGGDDGFSTGGSMGGNDGFRTGGSF